MAGFLLYRVGIYVFRMCFEVLECAGKGGHSDHMRNCTDGI